VGSTPTTAARAAQKPSPIRRIHDHHDDEAWPMTSARVAKRKAEHQAQTQTSTEEVS
jgi:hypothetical protein